ncbi:hypothetical protein ALC57_01471 [Trachymyrmex cornetzi]|uniref:Uncharacterized protein n=1 Tax=Trachymyrmex cornetzi TaxID=471704 RepID=A0A151JQF7_9HYME|nr:hypothetical protein ALC57_01471 [Trachymyrmex cornetzi]
MDRDFNQAESDLLNQSHQIANLRECFAWIEECNELINQLEECNHVKRPQLSIGCRQSLIATIARLEGTKTQFERQFLHFGGDYASTSNNNDNNVERSFGVTHSRLLMDKRLYEGGIELLPITKEKYISFTKNLADILENFRDKCIESYGLDPAYYYTLQNLKKLHMKGKSLQFITPQKN